jgi:hypothetical protein
VRHRPWVWKTLPALLTKAFSIERILIPRHRPRREAKAPKKLSSTRAGSCEASSTIEAWKLRLRHNCLITLPRGATSGREPDRAMARGHSRPTGLGNAMAAYDAFLSYSHAKDKPIAAALQSVIQRLGKPWYRRRALRVFRDDTSLAATPGLWPSIEVALGNSRFLILLASPEAAASPWVNKEVSWWLDHKRAETLLIALTDGELTKGEPRRADDRAAPSTTTW